MRKRGIIWNALFSALLFSGFLIAQEQAKPEMTKDAWKQAMEEATAKRDQLKSEVDELDKQVAELKQRDAQLAEDIRKGNEELTALMGESQRKEFEQRLTRIEATLNNLEQLSGQVLFERESDLNDVQSSIGEAKEHKLALLQEYKDRITAQEQRLNQMRSLIAQLKTESNVIVVGTWAEDRACLWNIAKKHAVYGDPALWVKLWQRNKSEISDPDIIHPGQKLQIPSKAALTAEEISARDEYYNLQPTTNGNRALAEEGDERD